MCWGAGHGGLPLPDGGADAENPLPNEVFDDESDGAVGQLRQNAPARYRACDVASVWKGCTEARRWRAPYGTLPRSRRAAFRSKNNAWLMTADTIAGWKGLVNRNAGSGRSPVRKRSG